MNIETIKAVADIVKVLSVTALLWLALYGNLKGWWVSGREHKAKCDDNDRLRAERDAAIARVDVERSHNDAMAAAAASALDRFATGGANPDRRREGGDRGAG